MADRAQHLLELHTAPLTGAGYWGEADYDSFIQLLERLLLSDDRVDVVARCDCWRTARRESCRRGDLALPNAERRTYEHTGRDTLITIAPYDDIVIREGDTVELRRDFARFGVHDVPCERVARDVARFTEMAAAMELRHRALGLR